MVSRKIKILGIAPYEGMKTAMQKLAEDRSDLELDVYVGDLDKGLEIARQNFGSNYDVIISRGGTAEMIGRATSIPVIEISLSVYDILRAMKLAENYSDRYAIVGFPAITDSARILCSLLKYNIDIVTIHDEGSVQETLKDLKKKGYRMAVCDMIANTTAKKIGLNAILITSGTESIETAFDLAVKLSRSYAVIKEENRFLNAVIRRDDTITAVFDQNGNLFFSTFEKNGLSPSFAEKLQKVLKKELVQARLDGERKILKSIGGTSFSITSKPLTITSTPYTVFYITESPLPVSSWKKGITLSARNEEEEKLSESFYGITGIGQDLSLTIGQMSKSSQPVLISGEEGTGKEQVLRQLYVDSPFKNNPLISIDFTECDDKSWDFLLNHHNSPFVDNNNTIALKNIHVLPGSKLKQLLAAIRDTSLHRRNRLFLTAVCGPDETVPACGADFIKTFSCLSLWLPPLRTRTKDLPDMISLYIGALNVELAKQIIGLEDGAMELLKSYRWPSNYSQFKRVLRELAVITTEPYIRSSDVCDILRQENIFQSSGSFTITNLFSEGLPEKTLDEINQEIVQLVLTQTRGNQTAAAKRLGISRTTMWRLLKK